MLFGNRKLRLNTFPVIIVFFFSNSALAEETPNELTPTPQDPTICNGISPDYSPPAHTSYASASCPAGYATYGAGFIDTTTFADAEEVGILADCCKLPSSDILLPEHIRTTDRCPDGYVVTAGVGYSACNECAITIRCT